MASNAFDFNPWTGGAGATGGKIKLWVKKFVDDGDALSPIISPNDVALANVARNVQSKHRQLPGLEMNPETQLEQLAKLADQWKAKNPQWPAEKTDERFFHYNNNSYSYFDAMTLFAMLAEHRPKRVLAFVDQFQFACFLDIIDVLELTETEFIFVEPDPERLRKYTNLPSDSKHRIICNNLQALKLAYFTALQADDMLFVDTTHVGKAGSDVCRFFNDVLPNLAVGVHVHIHDVFWPFEYPEGWLAEGRSWNECYMLRSWLQFNEAFEVTLFLNYLWTFHQTECLDFSPDSKLNPGGAIWIQRKK